ncbi:hypothetical protein Mapa_017778 [Marchantia paleacea]|nr:hypothetical protein Mapa_017778 [Marchantia paleacea]
MYYRSSNSALPKTGKRDTFLVKAVPGPGGLGDDRFRVKKEMTEVLPPRAHYQSDTNTDSDEYSCGGQYTSDETDSDFTSGNPSSPLIHSLLADGSARHQRMCASTALTTVDYEDDVMTGDRGDGETRITQRAGGHGEIVRRRETDHERAQRQLSMLALMLAAFRRSLLTCRTVEEECTMDIGWPTNVQHVAHVTFDRYNGFLGLPVEFEVDVPRRVPSASVSVFGVSAESMQCSFDPKGNSVPTILLLMQKRLYSQGGLKIEGIFRINAESIHEEHARKQLNKGIVPNDIDLHCLAGLIKAWFRELPRGVLDSLSPEQVMQCHAEEQCVELVKLLPPTQAALLDWAVNLMADVAQEELSNKMNARNIAMVFAPNMTQMADPLTALMHAVQVMNFLKTLILRTLRDREEAVLEPKPAPSCPGAPDEDGHNNDYGGALLNGYHDRAPVAEAPRVEYHQEYCKIVIPKKRGKGKAKGGRLVNTIDQQNERVEAW